MEAIERQTELLSPHEFSNETPEAPPFASFGFSATEVLTLYGALRTYSIALAQQDDLNQSERVLALMKTIRPAAAEASKLFQGEQKQ